MDRKFTLCQTLITCFVALALLGGCAGAINGEGGGESGGDNGSAASDGGSSGRIDGSGIDTGGIDAGGIDTGGTDAGDTGGSGDDTGTNGSDDAVVKTQIKVGLTGKIEAGDDLIVYGVGTDEDENVVFSRFNQPAGVHYIVPSRTSNETNGGTMISGSDLLFGHRNFKVVGKKVALVRSNRAVTVYDTTDDSMVDISSRDITLVPFSDGYNEPGQMVSDGPLIATINDPDVVSDGNAIKVVDLSGTDPVIISLPNPAGELDEIVLEYTQVAVDADSRRVAAAGASFQNDLYVWNIDDPETGAERFDFPGDDYGLIGERTQMRLDGDYLLYHDDLNGTPVVMMLNVADGSVVRLDPTLITSAVAMNAGSFGYFMKNEDADLEEGTASTLVLRSGIGSTSDPTDVTLAGQLEFYDFLPTGVDLSSTAGPTFSQEECLSEGPKRVGYGESMCIAPDGSMWFIGGASPPKSKDYILFSNGGAFENIPDPEESTVSGNLTGSDITCSNDIFAFRGLRDFGDGTGCIPQQDWVVSFIMLEKFGR